MESRATSGRFVVDLSDMDLDKDILSNVERSIHSAVLQSLVAVRPEKELAIRFPVEWLGIIVNPDILQLRNLDQMIAERMRF